MMDRIDTLLDRLETGLNALVEDGIESIPVTPISEGTAAPIVSEVTDEAEILAQTLVFVAWAESSDKVASELLSNILQAAHLHGDDVKLLYVHRPADWERYTEMIASGLSRVDRTYILFGEDIVSTFMKQFGETAGQKIILESVEHMLTDVAAKRRTWSSLKSHLKL